jgi:hypothetical protein
MSLEPDRGLDMSGRSDISDGGQMSPNGPDSHDSRTQLRVGYIRCIRYVRHRSDIYDLELMPRLWNLVEISDLVGYAQCNKVKNERKNLQRNRKEYN